MRTPWIVLTTVLVACDGDGCNGGPNGPATKFCQEALARVRSADGGAGLGPSCEQCCIQEVHYKGRVENGLCVCR
jgi:hypothetical protein